MSRPTTSTRSGFSAFLSFFVLDFLANRSFVAVEAQGCGAQVLMSAKTALEMGATIYGSE